jgi:hypothetical protein
MSKPHPPELLEKARIWRERICHERIAPWEKLHHRSRARWARDYKKEMKR